MLTVSTETLADGRVVISVSENHARQVIVLSPAAYASLRKTLTGEPKRRWQHRKGNR